MGIGHPRRLLRKNFDNCLFSKFLTGQGNAFETQNHKNLIVGLGLLKAF